MTTERTELLARLAERVALGATIDPAEIPPALREAPEFARLLKLARVAGVLDANAATPDPSPRPAPSRIGPWRLLHIIGSGGMGEVWLGERDDGTVEQRVAIKRVRADLPQFGARLREERRILARLEHPNIARFVDAGFDEAGAPWLALEFVEGATLTDWCRAKAPPLADRLRLFLKVCAAVEHAHRHLVVHRDLKPGNVLVDASGEPKLLDFGIAKLLDGSGREATAAALTPAYAAPEQLRGGEVSTATDVYALGLLLFRLLADALPDTRTGESAAAVLSRLDHEETQRPSARAAHAEALPYPASALAGDLDAIVAQAIRARPEDRYGTVAELAADIERHLDSRPVRAREPTRWYRFSRFAARHRLPLALGALAIVALVAGSVVALAQAARAEREAASARRELARAEQVSGFLASLFREQDPLSRGGAQSRSPQATLADAVARVDRELDGDPLTAARLLRVLGEAQLNLGELGAARTTLERGRAQADAAGDPLLGAGFDALAGTLALRELRQDDAERLFAQALAAATRLRGPASLEAARIEASRALSLVQLGRFKDAREAAGRADAVLSARLPAADPERINARIVVGLIAEQLREDAAAQDALRSAIAAIEAAYGFDDARLVVPLQSLGEVLRRARAFDEGRALLLRGAGIARSQFGARHISAANILLRLATLERDAGDARRAIAVLDEAEAALPDGEVGARAQLLATRGGTWAELGDGARAEADLREAVRLRRDSGGLRNGLAWFNQAQLGEALLLQGRLAEADALQAEAARELRALLGPDAYQNALVAQRWAKTIEARGDFARAAAQWRESARLIEKTYGLDHFGHLDMASRLAAALARTPDGRAEAIALADALLARWQDKPDTRDRIAALRVLRCGLVADAADADAARALLARTDLVADDDQRAALARCADR
jgi:serine/threonine-protein kinase